MKRTDDKPRADQGPQVSGNEVAGEQARRPREDVGLWQNDTQNDTQGALDLGRLFRDLISKNQDIAAAMERAMGIEPTSVAWEATALPLSYARVGVFSHAAGGTGNAASECAVCRGGD